MSVLFLSSHNQSKKSKEDNCHVAFSLICLLPVNLVQTMCVWNPELNGSRCLRDRVSSAYVHTKRKKLAGVSEECNRFQRAHHAYHAALAGVSTAV